MYKNRRLFYIVASATVVSSMALIHVKICHLTTKKGMTSTNIQNDKNNRCFSLVFLSYYDVTSRSASEKIYLRAL